MTRPTRPMSSTTGPSTAPRRPTCDGLAGRLAGHGRRHVAGRRAAQVRAAVLAEGDAGAIVRPAARAGHGALRRARPFDGARHAGGNQPLAAVAAEGEAGPVLGAAARAWVLSPIASSPAGTTCAAAAAPISASASVGVTERPGRPRPRSEVAQPAPVRAARSMPARGSARRRAPAARWARIGVSRSGGGRLGRPCGRLGRLGRSARWSRDPGSASSRSRRWPSCPPAHRVPRHRLARRRARSSPAPGRLVRSRGLVASGGAFGRVGPGRVGG